MFSRMKAKLDTVPFHTWGHSDMGDVLMFFPLFETSEVQMHSVFIYIFHIYLQYLIFFMCSLFLPV